MREVTMDTTEIQRITQEYDERLNATKVNNLQEMNEFLKIYDLSRLNHEELRNINRQINHQKIETIIKNLSKNKTPESDSFTSEFYKTFKENLISILKLFQELKEILFS